MGGNTDAFGDDIHAVAGHAEEGRGFEIADGHFLSLVKCLVHLVVGPLEGDAVHDVAIEAMVEGLIEVVAGLVVLEPLAQHSREQVKRVSTEVTAGLGDDCVSQGVVFSDLQGLDGLLVEIG